MIKVFIHTINGLPAQYYEGGQICYGSRRSGIKTVNTLAQIKKEQRATNKWRKKLGYDTHPLDYEDN